MALVRISHHDIRGFVILLAQGYLAHKKHPPPRTLQKGYTGGPMVVLGGNAFSYERGTTVSNELHAGRRRGVCRSKKQGHALVLPV